MDELFKVFQDSNGVSTDTRKIEKGTLFFALKGANFDANEYAGEALEKGAIAVVVDDPDLKGKDGHIWVPDVLTALQDLARHYRRQLNIPFLAITGTNGKTTTKELCHAVLSTEKRTYSTRGNFNNHIGVPLTLLEIPKDTEVAIIEMGASHLGNIKELAEIAEPEMGIITSIGKAHLEGFGDIQGVIRTKGELYDYLAENGGTALVNSEVVQVVSMADKREMKKWFYGDEKDTVHGDLKAEVPVEFAAHIGELSMEIRTQLFGGYNFHNALTAIAVGTYLGVQPDNIKKGLEEYLPTNNRSQIQNNDQGGLVIKDAYNANPTSMLLALKSLNARPGKKIAILGDMLELGTESSEEHKTILDWLKMSEIQEVYLVGEEFGKWKEKFEFRFFDNISELIELKKELDWAKDSVLVKGSRGIQLERIFDQL